MSPDTPFANCLEDLRQLLVEERDCIRELNMDRLTELQERKKDLLPIIEKQEGVSADQQEMARNIRFENRRNAYLLKFSLNWIRNLMEMFGRSKQPASYGRNGNQVTLQMGGGLLSGKV